MKSNQINQNKLNQIKLNSTHIGCEEGDESWSASHPTIQYFWNVVHDLTHEEKQKLLIFVTGKIFHFIFSYSICAVYHSVIIISN